MCRAVFLLGLPGMCRATFPAGVPQAAEEHQRDMQRAQQRFVGSMDTSSLGTWGAQAALVCAAKQVDGPTPGLAPDDQGRLQELKIADSPRCMPVWYG